MKETAPFAKLGTANYANQLVELHDTGKALIEKLGTLQWKDRDICLKEWCEFYDAFEFIFSKD